MRQGFIKKALALASAMVVAATSALPAFAASNPGKITTDAEASISVICRVNLEPINGAKFDVYKIADVSENCVYSLSGDFSEYPIDLNITDASDWRKVTETVGSLIVRDNLQPSWTIDCETTNIGMLDGITPGLYYLNSPSFEFNGYTYHPEPFMLSVPTLDSNTQEWIYDVEAVVKFERELIPEEPVERRVIKIWQGNGTHPTSIQAQLFGDGQLVDTVELNSDNQWRHHWTGLDPDVTWTIVEQTVPSGYYMASVIEGVTTIITNTRIPENPPTIITPPPTVTTPPPTVTNNYYTYNVYPQETPDVLGANRIPEQPAVLGSSRLPQTGMQWAPVIALFVFGGILVISGTLVLKSEDK